MSKDNEKDLVTTFFDKLDAWIGSRGISAGGAYAVRLEAENALRDLLNFVTEADGEEDDEEEEEPTLPHDELRKRTNRLKAE